MKRIKLKNGTARVEENVSVETMEALNRMSELVSNKEAMSVREAEEYLKKHNVDIDKYVKKGLKDINGLKK